MGEGWAGSGRGGSEEGRHGGRVGTGEVGWESGRGRENERGRVRGREGGGRKGEKAGEGTRYTQHASV